MPALPADGDIASLQMFNNGSRISAGLSIEVLNTRSVDNAEREIG